MKNFTKTGVVSMTEEKPTKSLQEIAWLNQAFDLSQTILMMKNDLINMSKHLIVLEKELQRIKSLQTEKPSPE